MTVINLEEDTDLITSTKKIDLYGTDEAFYINNSKSRVEWGQSYKVAGTYRDICKSNSDILRIRHIGVIFELTWSVSNFWLWKNTNDMIVSDPHITDVAKLRYTEDYGFSENKSIEIAKDILNYIENNQKIQSNIVDSRNEQLNEDSMVSNIHILDPEDYEGEYILRDVLFTTEDKNEFISRAEDYKWLDDPKEYIQEKFQQSKNRDSNLVVTVDASGKPVINSIDYFVSMDERYTLELAKIIEIGEYRRDIDIKYESDYESGDLIIMVECK